MVKSFPFKWIWILFYWVASTVIYRIPEFQEYVLEEWIGKDILHPFQVQNVSQELEAWVLRLQYRKQEYYISAGEMPEKQSPLHSQRSPRPPLNNLNSVTDYLKAIMVSPQNNLRPRLPVSCRRGRFTPFLYVFGSTALFSESQAMLWYPIEPPYTGFPIRSHCYKGINAAVPPFD